MKNCVKVFLAIKMVCHFKLLLILKLLMQSLNCVWGSEILGLNQYYSSNNEDTNFSSRLNILNGDSQSNKICQPLMFVFGASLADTGEYSTALNFSTSADFPPYGMDYFSIPSGRWSNGRVFTDFISQGLGYGLLSPYLRYGDSNFTFGANFATAGSTARTLGTHLFPLGEQMDQFKELLSKMLITRSQSASQTEGKYSQQQIKEAIYLFETAMNDYYYEYNSTLDFDEEALVLDILNAMESAFRKLYSLGGRNLLVMNVLPLGCMPAALVDYASFEEDAFGCKLFLNSLSELHNQHLESLLANLAMELPDANWILFDAHSLFLEGFHYPSSYGIKHPFDACCGVQGKQQHNYNPNILCGSRGYINGTYVEAIRCNNPSDYLIWDFVHPVESFAKYIGDGVLTSKYLRPKFNITNTCLSVS